MLTIPIFLVVRRRPEDIGLLPDGEKPDGTSRRSPARASADAQRRSQQTTAQPSDGWTARQAMGTPSFWLVSTSTFLVPGAASGIGFNMVPYFIEQGGLSTTQAATVLSASTLLSLCNLGWGFLADRFSPRRITLCGYFTTLGTLSYMLTVNNLGSAWIFGIAWGVFSSASDALISMIMAQYYGRSSYGTIMGALRPFEAGGLGVGQSLGALIYDFTGSYRPLIFISMVFYVTATRVDIPGPSSGRPSHGPASTGPGSDFASIGQAGSDDGGLHYAHRGNFGGVGNGGTPKRWRPIRNSTWLRLLALATSAPGPTRRCRGPSHAASAYPAAFSRPSPILRHGYMFRAWYLQIPRVERGCRRCAPVERT